MSVALPLATCNSKASRARYHCSLSAGTYLQLEVLVLPGPIQVYKITRARASPSDTLQEPNSHLVGTMSARPVYDTPPVAQQPSRRVTALTGGRTRLVQPRVVVDGCATVTLASRKRFEPLSGLRALACLGVLVVHTAILFAVGNSVWQW